MQETRSGDVRDLVAVGDVDIRVIGADAPVLDSQVPVRQVMEQIVAKTGIPPFMLAELELHGADERSAGGYADHGNHRPPPDTDAGGGKNLPDVAADAGQHGDGHGGLGGHQFAG